MTSVLKSLLAKAGFHLIKRSETGDFMLEGISSPLKYLLWRELLWGKIKTLRGLSFVQVGANDGSEVDPIRQLVERNRWKGVCVEPLPIPYAQLTKNYAHLPEVKTVRAAIFEKAGSKTMYTVDATKVPGSTASYPSAYSSFFREHLYQFENLVPNIREYIVEEEVPAITFDQLLAENKISQFDVLQIDAEGYDVEIIKMINFSKISPRFINFEHCNLKPGEHLEAVELLMSHGYQVSMGSMDTAAVKCG